MGVYTEGVQHYYAGTATHLPYISSHILSYVIGSLQLGKVNQVGGAGLPTK